MTAGILDLTNGTVPTTPASGLTGIYANASKKLAQLDDTGLAVQLVGGGCAATASPADPSGTANTTGLMMGLAGSFTPTSTGRVKIDMVGTISNSTATAGDGCKVQLRYGTGSAPANAGALTGTPVGSIISMLLERSTASDPYPFSLIAVVTGLTVNTAYWLDISAAAITGGTAIPKAITWTVVEV